MAETVTLQVESRDPQKNQGTGTRVARRLRSRGRVPAIVYGHKQTPVPITVARDDVLLILKRSTHLAQLQIGDTTQMVLVRDIQWDHLGKEVLHLDFARVSAEESIETEVRLEVRGTPAGASEGGVLEVLVHSIKVTCRANAIPDSIRVDVSGLHLDEAAHVRDLVLPEGVTVDADPDLLLMHVVAPRAAEVAAPAIEPGPSQPELIRRPEEKEES